MFADPQQVAQNFEKNLDVHWMKATGKGGVHYMCNALCCKDYGFLLFRLQLTSKFSFC